MENQAPDIIPELAELRKPQKAFSVPPAPELTGLSTQIGGGVPGVPTDYAAERAKYKKPEEASAQQAKLLQRQQQLETDIGTASQAKEQYLAEAKADIARQQRESAQTVEANLEATRAAFPYKEFHPTKDNIETLSTLFGLIGVVGMAMGGSGKMSAMNSLNAMSGMMKGWQQGRADLWKKEKEEFDKNMQRTKAILEDAYRDADRAMKTLAYNVQEAEALAGQSAAKLGGQVGKQILEKQGVEKFYTFLEGVKKDLTHAEDKAFQEKKYAEERAFKEKEFKATQAFRASELELKKQQLAAKEKQATEKAAGAGKSVGQIQFRYNAVITNNLEQVKNGVNQMMAFDVQQMPPSLGEALTNPAGGIATGVESLLARTLSEREARLYQQAGAGVKNAITNIEASGIPRGATVSAAKEYGKMEPRGGDTVLSKAMYLAEIKQIAELGLHDLETSGGTPEQVNRARQLVKEINAKVPWTVTSVAEVARKSKSLSDDDLERLAQQAEGMDKYLATLRDARVVAQSQDAKAAKSAPVEGQTAKSKSGRDIIFRDGEWHYIGE